MTELEHVEIEGFKGLVYAEFEPTDINLITGRNNTGKTSFLESLNLSFDINYIKEFGAGLEKIINVNSDFTTISTESREKTTQLQLEYPDDRFLKEYLAEALVKNISLNYQTSIRSFDSESIPEWVTDKERLVQEAATRVLEENWDAISEADRMCLVLRIDGKPYPYVDFGHRQHGLLSDVYDELQQILKAEFEDWDVKESAIQVITLEKGSKSISFHLRMRRSPGSGVFLNEPPDKQGLRFVDSTLPAEDISDIDKEENAIKIDDISDYIKNVGLVDDLKTFNLDYLVFEKDDEKYDIPYEFMGDGFKAIVGLLWELMDDEIENEIVLLEEPENHMHPGYIREMVYFLIDLAREEDVQLFITTHDSDFINDFFTENLTDEEEEYLEDEFSLLRMEEDSAVVEDYETARKNLKDLHLDLRGI